MGGFSFWHILLVALLVMLLFGGKRFSAMMGDVAKGLKNFKAGMADDEAEQRYGTDQQRDRGRLGTPEAPIDVAPRQHASDPFAPPPQDPRA
ncbi:MULTISPECIES: twin-arginine translocase TatA/TatE family subunit [Sphingomonas]|uniref:twin-arginine translocase TatA/TatE family subunit n=1 Tax=Sphingomonas TaxID=13687 RepID=UPI000DEEFA42|nr:MULTISPECIES: twin-arginine translocase TatA/TatE family subunit [Sphingomonas]